MFSYPHDFKRTLILSESGMGSFMQEFRLFIIGRLVPPLRSKAVRA
jgi:hypothetical protein